jgi:hypothetical protein
MAKISKFGGKNLVTFLRSLSDGKQEVFKYFHYDSKFWGALKQHICKAPRFACVIKLPARCKIPSYRGTGPAISFRSVHIGGGDCSSGEWQESNRYCLKFAITFVLKDDDYMENPPTQEKTYELLVPFDLEKNFTQSKFDTWVNGILDAAYAGKLAAIDKKLSQLQQMRDVLEKNAKLRLEKSRKIAKLLTPVFQHEEHLQDEIREWVKEDGEQ